MKNNLLELREMGMPYAVASFDDGNVHINLGETAK
jgi:hypothetical protein